MRFQLPVKRYRNPSPPVRRKKGQEKERWRRAVDFTSQFIQRKDIHAVQLQDGRYVSIHRPFTLEMMDRHLRGKLTLGAYLLDAQSQTRQVVLDADEDAQFEQLRQLAQELETQQVPSYLETSRRGGHLRLFFPEPVSGQKARRLGQQLLAAHHLQLEIFPKQEMIGDGPGSLVRVPFGVHQVTGRRYGFITPDGESFGTLQEQVDLLAHPMTVPLDFVEAHQYCPGPRSAAQHSAPGEIHFRQDGGETTWERVKKSISAYEFISQFVELKPTGSGYVGHCPFHDDQHPSFSVNPKGNYWHCFAGCGGGSIIDFWMAHEGIDFPTALSELEEMLLPQ